MHPDGVGHEVGGKVDEQGGRQVRIADLDLSPHDDAGPVDAVCLPCGIDVVDGDGVGGRSPGQGIQPPLDEQLDVDGLRPDHGESDDQDGTADREQDERGRAGGMRDVITPTLTTIAGTAATSTRPGLAPSATATPAVSTTPATVAPAMSQTRGVALRPLPRGERNARTRRAASPRSTAQ